jgi:Icc-related predicted phosphoesterase
MLCHFVSDLHGKTELYEKLAVSVISEKPDAVFIGGDISPFSITSGSYGHFFTGYLASLLKKITEYTENKSRVFLIPGNDDPAEYEKYLKKLDSKKLLCYVQSNWVNYLEHDIAGYAYVPPTPFLLKDWEKYDVSRYLDPGDVSPEDGYRTVEVEPNVVKYSTIADDLKNLAGGKDLTNSIILFHTPPHKTNLDRVANDRKMFEHVPLELNVGSIAVRRFIEEHKPLLTLHGHIHESARITGSWKDKIGSTHCFSAAHDGIELAVVMFDTMDLANAVRVLI